MGMATILQARRIVLMATGKAKAKCVDLVVNGPITAKLPASFLQLHPDVDLMLDEAAAGNTCRAHSSQLTVSSSTPPGPGPRWRSGTTSVPQSRPPRPLVVGVRAMAPHLSVTRLESQRRPLERWADRNRHLVIRIEAVDPMDAGDARRLDIWNRCRPTQSRFHLARVQHAIRQFELEHHAVRGSSTRRAAAVAFPQRPSSQSTTLRACLRPD